MLNRIFLVLMSCALLMSCSNSGTASSNSSGSSNTLIITDIHFDPFTSCGESVTYQSQQCLLTLIHESNPALWHLPTGQINHYSQETNNTFFMDGLSGLAPYISSNQVSSVFLNGDLLSHHFDTDFAKYLPNGTQEELTDLALNTMTYVVYNVAQATQHTKMYYIFGNNDTDTADYLYPTENFMQRLTTMISPYMADPAAFSSTFGSGGYSNMNLSNDVTVIGLNFNLLTQQADSTEERDVTMANQQLSWLEQQLAEARVQHKKVIILQHEPFGINVYNVANGATSSDEEAYTVLDQTLQTQYLAVYTSYNDIINNYYYGHYHMENIEVAADLFAFSTLAFNVLFGNNPGFKILHLSQLGQLQDYTTYYSDFSSGKLSWQKLYSLNETYNISPADYVSYFTNFPSDRNQPAVNSYIKYYNGLNTIEPLSQPISQPGGWPYYYCGIMNMQPDSYQSCLANMMHI